MGGQASCSPSIDSAGVVYICSTNGNLYAINGDGTLRWTSPIVSPSGGISVALDGALFVAGGDAKVHALGSRSSKVTITSFTTATSYVIGGATSTATVTLSQPAPAQGAVVYLYGSFYINPVTYIAVPYCLTIPAGQTSGTFTFGTVAVLQSGPFEMIAATDLSYVGTTVTITPPGPISVTFAPTSVVGGNSVTGTLTLSGAAPGTGLLVTLTSLTTKATVQANVVVTGGQTTATFPVNTSPVAASTTATIVASVDPVTASGSFTILSPGISQISISPSSVVGGTTSVATITLTGNAPNGGYPVTLLPTRPA